MNVKHVKTLIFALAVIAPLGYLGWIQYQEHKLSMLSERAEAYWNARAANDLLTAFRLEASQAAGNMQPDEVEQNHYHGIRIVSAEIGTARVDGDDGEVEVVVISTVPFGGSLMREPKMSDHWTYLKGEWFHGTPEKGGSGLEKDPAPGALKSSPGFMKQKQVRPGEGGV